MIIHISDRIYKHFSETQKDKIREKIYKFAKEICANHSNITSLSKGFWARQIISCPGRYKLRVSNKDRIIFEYGKTKDEIYFLDYCNHDEQIRTAKQIKNTLISELEIDHSEFQEDSFDNYMDKKYQQMAFSFIEDSNFSEAAEFLKKAGDKENKKKANFIVVNNYKNIRNIFSDKEYRTELKIILNGLILKESDLLYIFNRLYSEYGLVLAPYYMILYQATAITYFIKDAPKNLFDYNKKLSEQLSKDLAGITNDFCIIGCFCIKKQITKLEDNYIIDLKSRKISTAKKNLDYNEVWNLAPLPDLFSDADNKVNLTKKLAKDNLDFIFS